MAKKVMTDAAAWLADGERSGVMSRDTIQVMNAIQLLGKRIKENQRYDGNELRLFIREMERNGVKIPDRPLDTLPATELRALTLSFNSKVVNAAKPEAKPWTDAELTERVEMQKRMFDDELKKGKQ